MKRGIGYYRVSTEAQDINRQKSVVEEYCRNNDIKLVRSYEDKITGTTFDRNGFNQLLESDTRQYDIVVISEFSRFSRDADLLNMMNEFSKLTSKGLDVVFLDDPTTIYKGGTTMPIFEIIKLVFKGFFAQEERNAILKRLRDKREQLMDADSYAFMNSKVPYGFEVVENPERVARPKDKNVPRRIIKINDTEAEVVRQIFKRYAEGESSLSITSWFRTNIRWVNKVFISKLLSNEIYMGKRNWGEKTYEIQGIIDIVTWERVQERKRLNRIHYQNTHKINGVNLLKGLVKCGKCGGSMTMFYSSTKVKTRVVSLTCMNHLPFCISKNQFICDNAFGIQKRVLELIVSKSYVDVVGTDAFLTSLAHAIEEMENQIEFNNNMIDNLKTQIYAKEKERAKIPQLILKSNLNSSLVSSLNEMDEQIQLEIRDFQQKIRGYEKDTQEIKNKIEQFAKTKSSDVSASISQSELAEEFQNAIQTVKVFSPYKFSHFIQIVYKNGYISDYMCWSYGKKAKIAELRGGSLNTKRMTYRLDGEEWDWQDLFDFLTENDLIQDTKFTTE